MPRAKKSTDDPHARIFPALPPAPGGRGRFAASWWGQEWVAALEQTSMDAGRLSRGRTYARRGAVGEMTVTAGLIKAKVHGSQPRPYNSSVRVRLLDDDEWDRFLDAVAAKTLHIAALLDRDMPEELAEDAAGARVPLLPFDDELEPSCSCPDWGYPCKHAAALCYQIARILDQDPFVLLLLRGRDEPTVMAELHRRNAARAAVEAGEALAAKQARTPVAGRRPTSDATPARAAFQHWQPHTSPTPSPAGPVERPGTPVTMDAAAPIKGFDPPALEQLAADAAARAKALLDEYLHPGVDADGPSPSPLMPRLDERRDAVRMLAGDHRDIHVFARFAAALAVEPGQLARGIKAWRYSGEAGFDVLEEPWTPPQADLTRARMLLESGWDDDTAPTPKPWRNRWTFADFGVQLRYGRDGHWHPYRSRDGTWWPAGPPSHDPTDALTSAL